MRGFLRFLWRAVQYQPFTTVFGTAVVIAGISYQEWLAEIAKEPPWYLANHLIQLAGIAFGVLIVAYVFYRQSEIDRTSSPRPNMNLEDAIEYLRIRSEWAVGRVNYSKDQDHIIEEDIDEIIRDAAAQGRITIWGRPGSSIIGRPIKIAVSSSEWPQLSLDLTTMGGGGPRGVCARSHAQDQYCWLRNDERELYREWPPASYARLIFDKTWKSRRQKTP